MRKERNLKVRKILAVLVSVACMIPLYVVLHEGGHALVAVMCGARITKFSILGAYMNYEGGQFSAAVFSLFHAAGMLLPLLAAILYMIAYQSGARSILYRIFSFLVLLLPVGAVLAWVGVPIFCLAGYEPTGDDVKKFLDSSGVHPLAVTAVAALLLAGCIGLAWKKKILQNYWDAVAREGRRRALRLRQEGLDFVRLLRSQLCDGCIVQDGKGIRGNLCQQVQVFGLPGGKLFCRQGGTDPTAGLHPAVPAFAREWHLQAIFVMVYKHESLP